MTEYRDALEGALEVWGANEGESTEWGRASLAALMAGKASPLEVAESVYAALKPVDARGHKVWPKLRNGRLSVRSLENTSRPVQGAAAARKSLEAVLTIYRARALIPGEIERFIGGEGRLFGLLRVAQRSLRGDEGKS